MASKLALGSQVSRGRHGAIVYKSGRILSAQVNTNRNDPALFAPRIGAPHAVLRELDDPEDRSSLFTFHAEMRAIKPLSDESLEGATIYVARVFRDGTPALSRPCDACYLEIIKRGIKKVVFTLG